MNLQQREEREPEDDRLVDSAHGGPAIRRIGGLPV
jgi:hypothetical protein